MSNSNSTTAATIQSSASSSTNDSFVNSLIQELKTIKLSNNNHSTNNTSTIMNMNGSIDGIMPTIGEASINAKQNNSNSTQNAWGKQASLWDAAPHSPTYSMNTQYHSASSHSNSKESLWASTQSSPNYAHREQLQHQQHGPMSSASSTASSSSPSSLWENPSSKLSQASLMSKNDSLGSIWQTPPQTQSPVNKISNLWDGPNAMHTSNAAPMSSNGNGTGPIGGHALNANANVHHSGHNLIRPQDLAAADIWGTNNTNALAVKTKDPVGSLWAHPTPPPPATFNRMNSMITSTPNKSQSNNAIKSERNVYNHLPQINSTVKNGIQSSASSLTVSATATSAALASSSCLQLFSDEFINYLNMIN